MNQAISKFEDLLVQTKALHYGENHKILKIRDQVDSLVEEFIPKKSKYKKALRDINPENQEEATHHQDFWIINQENLLTLIQSVIDELKIFEQEKIAEAKDQDLIKSYQLELERTKNDMKKDLILAQNNHRYIKRKYEILRHDYQKLEDAYSQLLGKKSAWVTYLLICFPIVFFLLFFNLIIQPPWLQSIKYLVLVKTSISFAFISGFLYIPLKSKRLFLLVLFFLLAAVAFQVI